MTSSRTDDIRDANKAVQMTASPDPYNDLIAFEQQL